MQLPWLLLAALSQSPVAETTDTPPLTIPAPEAQKGAIAQQRRSWIRLGVKLILTNEPWRRSEERRLAFPSVSPTSRRAAPQPCRHRVWP
jgi:hypothetical protein